MLRRSLHLRAALGARAADHRRPGRPSPNDLPENDPERAELERTSALERTELRIGWLVSQD